MVPETNRIPFDFLLLGEAIVGQACHPVNQGNGRKNDSNLKLERRLFSGQQQAALQTDYSYLNCYKLGIMMFTCLSSLPYADEIKFFLLGTIPNGKQVLNSARY